MTESWALITAFPNYEVSNCGRVRNIKTGRVLKPGTQNFGHKNVLLCISGQIFDCSVHRLVLQTFVGPCPQGMECRHLDGNPANNHVDNLKWGTHKENMQDTIRHGHQVNNSGANHPRAKLTWEQVEEIRSSELSRCALAKRFNVCVGVIDNVVMYKSYKQCVK